MAVYFIRAGNEGAIKIGRATDPRKRLAALQTASPAPLLLLAVIENGDERAFHTQFAAHRLNGEWFHPAPELLALAAEHVALPAQLIRAPIWLNPAAKIVETCGGIDKTAELVRRDRSVVNRWLLPKECGGTGGRIPQHHAEELLKKVPALAPADFFPPPVPGQECVSESTSGEAA